jgi:hypothetical protein
MELRLEVARRLPCELQEVIWKTYNDIHILPNLMDEVETKLFNQEYETLLDDCSMLVCNIIESLLKLRNNYEIAFDISVDVAFDRLFECGSPDVDKVALLNVIKDNIHHPYLLKITIENTEMMEAYGCSKSTQIHVLMETLQDVYNIIMPYGDHYLNVDNMDNEE